MGGEASMTPEAQHSAVLEHLGRREQIAADTRAMLERRDDENALDPLANIDPAIRQAAEDEFYAKLGRHRHQTSDGRTIFLTPEEIAQRRRARTKRQRKSRAGSSYDHLSGDERRRTWLTWGFNIGAVLLGLLIVFFMLH